MSAPGDIPLGPIGRAALLEILARAREVPFEALEEAARMPSKINETVLALVVRAADGEELSERDANLLFWGLHVLAEVRDTRVFPPLLRLLRRPAQDLEFLLGDAVTASLTPVLVNTFDGGVEPLLEIVRDTGIDDFVRWSLFGAGTYLTATGAIASETYRALLIGFDDRRLASSSDDGWHGWAEAICLLGFSDLFPRIEAAFADGRLMDTIASVGDYHKLLADALARPDDLGRLAKDGLRPFGAAADELDWVVSDEEDDPGAFESDSPIRNPMREIGRNDPCPCGSGKKFKKCCLEAA